MEISREKKSKKYETCDHDRGSSPRNFLRESNRLSEVKRLELNDGRASDGVLVVNHGVVGGQDGVALTGRASSANRGSNRDLAVLDNNGREDGAGDKGESDEKRTAGDGGALSELKVNPDALGDRAGGASSERQGGESLDGESRVGGRAGSDERSSQRVDLVEVKGNIERLSGRCHCELATDESAVAGLDGQNTASGSEVVLVGNESGGTEVGAHTDTLENRGSLEESLGGKLAKVVSASGDGSGASSYGEVSH